jgi:hypothetical protein
VAAARAGPTSPRRRATGGSASIAPRKVVLDEVRAFVDAVPGLYRDLYMVWFRTG